MHIISVNLKKDVSQPGLLLITHLSHGNVGRGGGKGITDELEKIRQSSLCRNGSGFARSGEISFLFQSMHNGLTLPWYIRAWEWFPSSSQKLFHVLLITGQ